MSYFTLSIPIALLICRFPHIKVVYTYFTTQYISRSSESRFERHLQPVPKEADKKAILRDHNVINSIIFKFMIYKPSCQTYINVLLSAKRLFNDCATYHKIIDRAKSIFLRYTRITNYVKIEFQNIFIMPLIVFFLLDGRMWEPWEDTFLQASTSNSVISCCLCFMCIRLSC